MTQLGLALSGGGFRATLYHLGVVRYLKDVGKLDQVSHVASVSGGSILAAHLVLNWERYTGSDEQFEEAAAEVIRFVQYDVRNHVVRRMPLQYLMRRLMRFTRFDGNRFTPNASLESCYRELLFGDRCLYELPEHPRLHVLATNISNGGLTVFNRDGLFIQQRGESDASRYEHIAGKMVTIDRAVGASSAFPGLFPPVRLTAADLGVRDGEFATEWFTDGGVYDNLGIRAFYWLKQQNIELDQVLVSDAGKPFQVLGDATLGFFGQSVRATDILWDRVWQLECQIFCSQPGFYFLPITMMVEEDESATVLPAVVQAEVQSIRTDLDRFSDREINALAQHGYGVARAVCEQAGATDVAAKPAWAPIPAADLLKQVTLSRGSRTPSAATEWARELRRSSVRRVWSTALNARDWTSYCYLALAFLLLVVAPWQVYELYQRAQIQATVIDAVAAGDPDIREVLNLMQSDPEQGWVGEVVRENAEPSPLDYTDLELLTYSRVIDLRHWRPNEPAENRGYVYICDRVTLKLLESYDGDRRIRLALPIPTDEIEFRQNGTQIPAVITRVAKPYVEFGEQKTLYEFEYDLSGIPLGESVQLRLEAMLKAREPDARAQFIIRAKTDLTSVWMLFPSERPYRTYSLVRYPVDHGTAPVLMNARYSIDHPYGSLIGWSVVNPQVDTVYECRWKYE